MAASPRPILRRRMWRPSSAVAPTSRHIENIQKFGIPVVVAINHFSSDTLSEVEAVRVYAQNLGVEAILCRHWAEGSAGIEDLAYKVVELADSDAASFQPLYADELPLFEKIETVAREIYRPERLWRTAA